MSGPDEADRDKGFLARWSQRKQEAKQPEPKPDAPAAESAESSGSPAPQGEDVDAGIRSLEPCQSSRN